MADKKHSKRETKGKGMDLATLLCAVAGPLTPEEAEQLAPELIQSPDCTMGALFVELKEQPELPLLQEAVAAAPGLPELLAELDTLRRDVHGPWSKSAPVQRRWLPAQARRALLQGDSKLFDSIFHSYASLTRSDPNRDTSNMAFWNNVLGSRWAGHHLVPPGEPRRQLARLLGMRYILTPPGDIAPLPVDDMPPMLRLAALLAAADPDTLSDLDEFESEEDGYARAACLSMLEGDWKSANKLFTAAFRPRNILIYQIVGRDAAPLLTFALLCAMRVKAKPMQLEMWGDILLHVLPQYFPAEESESIIAFVHNLQVAGDLMTLQEDTQPLSQPDTPAACVPVALCYRKLPTASRRKLKGPMLTNAAEHYLQNGSPLLGYYAAAALVGSDIQLGQPLRQTIRQYRQNGIAPLYEEITLLPREDGNLLELLQKHMREAADSQEGLSWELVMDKDGKNVHHLRPAVHTNQPGTRRRDISIRQCYAAARTEQDMAAIFLGGGFLNDEKDSMNWISAMAGHPNLRISMPGKRAAEVRLRLEKPCISIRREKDEITLHLPNRPYSELRCINNGEWGVLRHSWRLDNLRSFIHAYGSGDSVSFPATQVNELYLLLHEWSEDFDYEGTLSASHEVKKEDSRVLAMAYFADDEVKIQLGIQVLPGVDKLVTPTTGPQYVDVRTPDGIWAVERDFDREHACIEAVCALCPGLPESKNYTWILRSTQESLEHLTRLDAAGVTIIRDGRQPIRCLTPAQPRLQLQARSTGGEWFDIGAELKVNEELTFTLQELLDALDMSVGSFLPVRCGYLHLPEPMEKQLRTLRHLMGVQGRSHGISAAALPALAEALGEENLPEELRARLLLMRSGTAPGAPASLNATLRPYQLRGFQWLVERANAGIGCCLADDMGLGKTIQLAALLLHVAHKGPSLVIAPLSLQGNWVNELAKFTPSLRVIPFNTHQPWRKPQANEVVLASYGQVSNNLQTFSPVPWNVLALDEAQAVKNPDSQRAKAVCQLHAFARVCLTGTPVENSVLDLWSLMHFLNPLLFGTRASFRRRFLGSAEGTRALDTVLAALLLRRTRAEVLTQLPTLTEQVIPIEFNEEERALYEAIRRRTLDKLAGGGDNITVLAELMRLRRACCDGRLVMPEFTGQSSKLEMLRHVLDELRETGHKALVFSQFTDVLDLVEPLLKKERLRTERLDGSTPPAKRTKAVERFQKGKADVFLISLKAGGTGLNLTAADYVILLDPWWNPAIEAQAAGRSHRIGQQKPVTVYRFIATHTVEERVLRMHEEKKELAETLLSGGSLPLGELRHLIENQ